MTPLSGRPGPGDRTSESPRARLSRCASVPHGTCKRDPPLASRCVRWSCARRAATRNALRMHLVRCGGGAARHTNDTQNTPAKCRVNFAYLGGRVRAIRSRPSRNSPRRAARRRRQCPRPGLGPGRSAAKSIDDAEHGTRLDTRDGAGADLVCVMSRDLRKTVGRTSCPLRALIVGWVVRGNRATRTDRWAARSSVTNRAAQTMTCARPAMA